MSVTIPFAADVEAKLRQQAAANGKDVDALIREAVEEKFALSATPEQKTVEQWAAEFNAWMGEVAARSAYPPGFVVDDSRATIYEGRGE